MEERTRELSTLLEVSWNVASTLELKPLLNLILDQLHVIAEYQGATVVIEEGNELVVAAYRGEWSEEEIVGLRHPAVEQLGMVWERFKAREYVLFDNVHGDRPPARAVQQYIGDPLTVRFSNITSVVMAPLVARERVIGYLAVGHSQPAYYTHHQAELVLTIANQAAVAIENARLYQQAHSLAALQERQRLARELHDSVSQALYGIGLGTYAAKHNLERNQPGVSEALDYVSSLAAAGLAEMRALIFELRPESLEVEGLVAALSKQVEALRARHRIAVQMELPNEPDLPLKSKEVLYRVAQEALHNVVKHAEAQVVHLRLAYDSEQLLLEVCDDGKGFDPADSFPGHLGLHSMQERVAELGGTFEVQSAPGKGTTIQVRIPY